MEKNFLLAGMSNVGVCRNIGWLDWYCLHSSGVRFVGWQYRNRWVEKDKTGDEEGGGGKGGGGGGKREGTWVGETLLLPISGRLAFPRANLVLTAPKLIKHLGYVGADQKQTNRTFEYQGKVLPFVWSSFWDSSVSLSLFVPLMT